MFQAAKVEILAHRTQGSICIRPRAVRHVWRTESGCRLQAASPGELPLLEALLTEHGTPLGGTEGHGRFLAARGTGGLCLDPIAGRRRPRTHPVGALGLAGLASFGLVLELFVGEKELLAGGPDEISTAIRAPQGLVLELHWSTPRELVRTCPVLPACYSDSRRSFFR